jgi:hypothetical protein
MIAFHTDVFFLGLTGMLMSTFALGVFFGKWQMVRRRVRGSGDT